MKKHPGIRLDKIPVSGGAGLIFVIGVLSIFLVEVPAIRLVLALGLIGGVVLAVIFHITDRTR